MKLNKPKSCMKGLLERTLHAKVWMSYAQFEMSFGRGMKCSCKTSAVCKGNKCKRPGSETTGRRIAESRIVSVD
jgi:hypothetical protein